MATPDYLNPNQARCFRCFRGFKKGNIDFEDCQRYNELYGPHLEPGQLCPDFQTILNDIVKAYKRVKKRDGITNPAILRALAEEGIENVPKESYE